METFGYILLALTFILYFYGVIRSMIFAVKSSNVFYVTSISFSFLLTIVALIVGKMYDSKMPNPVKEISFYAFVVFFIATLILGYFAEKNFKKSEVGKK